MLLEKEEEKIRKNIALNIFFFLIASAQSTPGATISSLNLGFTEKCVL